MVQHAETENKIINVINLDPAAEYFDYNPIADIRELIHLDDAMEDDEMRFGPNGGLIFCMECVLIAQFLCLNFVSRMEKWKIIFT